MYRECLFQQRCKLSKVKDNTTDFEEWCKLSRVKDNIIFPHFIFISSKCHNDTKPISHFRFLSIVYVNA